METYLITLLSNQQPRRQRVIENILMNRRTLTTLFWGSRYGILSWLGSNRQLERGHFDALLKQMKQDGLIEIENQFILLTKQGQVCKQQFSEQHYVPKHEQQYLKYNLSAGWPRLLLAGQVVSEFSYENIKYAPISFEDHELRYVKQWFNNNKSEQFVKNFKQEVNEFLLTLSETEAQFFTELLVGHDSPGLSIDQLTTKLAIPLIDGEVMATDLMVGIMEFAHYHQTLLKQLFQDLKLESPISHSGYITYQLFQDQYSIEQIEQMRHLKLSTIREHLLEAAIFDGVNFPYDRLLTERQLKALAVQYTGNIDDWQFKMVTDDKNLDFFDFRLFQIMRGMQNE